MPSDLLNSVLNLPQVNIRGIPHEEQQNALKEVAILRKLRHPNIIAYKDSYVEAGNLAIIMEFAQVRQGSREPRDSADSDLIRPEPLSWTLSLILFLYPPGR